MPKKYSPQEIESARRLFNKMAPEFFDNYAVVGNLAGSEPGHFVVWARGQRQEHIQAMIRVLEQELKGE